MHSPNAARTQQEHPIQARPAGGRQTRVGPTVWIFANKLTWARQIRMTWLFF
jgi:hypothetical protein